MESTIERIHGNVRNMYEAYPYPAYPLWAKLRWQEAYQGTANFAASLGKSASLYLSDKPRILLAGCGETQPYILRKAEASHHSIDAIDISQNSLRRAKTRLLWDYRNTDFIHSDLDHFLLKRRETYDHADCYGVLHHLANPSHTINLLQSSLKPGGTARIMVYNDKSRAWINHTKRALLLLGFNSESHKDIKAAQDFLKSVSYWVPNLKEKFNQMGRRSLENPARFVDTFFHAREARIPISDWYTAITEGGFRIIGLFDRYGELDDLENPLWAPPSIEDLKQRISDRRFENNLEIYLQKNSNISRLQAPKGSAQHIAHLMIKTAPQSWFQYEETKDIPFLLRQKIWWHHIRSFYLGQKNSIDLLLSELSIPARQRLARIGAIQKSQIHRKSYKEQLQAPIHEKMDTPSTSPITMIQNTQLPQIIRSILIRNKKKMSSEALIIERLARAQRS